MGFPGGSVVKNPSANAGDAKDAGSVPGSGKSPEVGTGNPLQHSYLETPMDRGAWQATAHGVKKRQTQPSDNKPLTQSQTFNSHLTQSLEYLKSALGMCGNLR